MAGDRTQDVRLDGSHLYPLSRLPSPPLNVFQLCSRIQVSHGEISGLIQGSNLSFARSGTVSVGLIWSHEAIAF